MRHVAQRGPDWDTIEAPLDLAQPICDWPAPGAVLIDCATMWLTNHVMDESDIPTAQAHFMAALAQPGCLRVVVSNELGQGIVPADALSRRFRQLQGELNQQIAAIADTVVFVTAGVPQVLKGSL